MRIFQLVVFLFLFSVLIIAGNYLRSVIRLADSSIVNNRAIFVGPRFLDQYTIQSLGKRSFSGSDFRIEKTLSDNSTYTSYLFSFKTSLKKVTGLMNVPKGFSPFPVVLMIRGYVDREKYTTGMGTQRAGEVFADKGYLTLAPDFLGYGGSDNPSVEPLEERFKTYTTLLDLYGLISEKQNGQCQMPNVKCEMLYLWAHSNGGQIALTFLEITGVSIPTVLWAPVSKPFPYSILYFTDDSDDHGKALRKVVSKFETLYDVNRYSISEYLNQIKAPILLQQGTKDESVPKSWSDELNKKLGILGKDTTYVVYEGADHNLLGSWSEAVKKDLEFFEPLTKYP